MLDNSPVYLFQCMAEESKYKGGVYGAKMGETGFRKPQVRGCWQASEIFVVELGSDSLASGGGSDTRRQSLRVELRGTRSPTPACALRRPTLTTLKGDRILDRDGGARKTWSFALERGTVVLTVHGQNSPL